MLTQEENEVLTRVGPGTPMGELFRRYWLPIAFSAELHDAPLARRILCEDLVVYRTKDGKVGVIDERCAHRRTSMTLGLSEEGGIRCGYHGWRYDLEGRCIEQPAEKKLHEGLQLKAYPAEELGGMIFAYMGPKPAPLLPRYDLFTMDHAFRDIGVAIMEFNWLQAMETSVDPIHAEWLHGRLQDEVRAREGKSTLGHYHHRTHIKVGFDLFKYGIVKRRVLEGGNEDEDGWKVGHPLIFPNMLKMGGGTGFSQFQIRVPIDDTRTYNIFYTAYTPPNGERPESAEVPVYEVPLKDARGKWLLDFIDGQDIAAWAEQGKITDRTKEQLGASDMGIVMLRRTYKEQLDAVKDGKDPLAVVRDAEENRFIEIPIEKTPPFADKRRFIMGLLETQAVRYSPLNDRMKALFS